MKYPMSAVPGIADLQKEVGDGRCPFCEVALPEQGHRAKKRFPKYCKDPECKRTYHLLYNAARRERFYRRGLTFRGTARKPPGKGVT